MSGLRACMRVLASAAVVVLRWAVYPSWLIYIKTLCWVNRLDVVVVERYICHR